MPKKKPTTAKKKAVKKTVKKTVKQAPTKKVAKKAAKKAGKTTTKKTAAKKTVIKSTDKAPAKEASKKASLTETVVPKAPEVTKDSETKSSKEADDSKSTPIVFSLDDVAQLMASKKSENETTQKADKKTVQKAPLPKKKVIVEDKPVEQRVLGAASLADILGFNPAEKKKSTDLSDNQVQKKWKKYYDLLIALRGHVSDELNMHTADTLKHSSRDDSGDLSNYNTHQADAGTDTFDRDFALSLVSSEQDALNEIEEAILRIKDGTYGVCEVTGKAIPAARLTAVPFARFSVEGQAEYEKNLRRKVDRSGSASLFGDASDAPKIAASDDDE